MAGGLFSQLQLQANFLSKGKPELFSQIIGLQLLSPVGLLTILILRKRDPEMVAPRSQKEVLPRDMNDLHARSSKRRRKDLHRKTFQIEPKRSGWRKFPLARTVALQQ